MNSAFHDIGSQFRRRSLKHPANRFDNSFTGIFHGFVCLLGSELYRAGRSIQLIDTANVNCPGFIQRKGSSKVLLDIFRSLVSDQDIAFLPEIFGNRFIKLISAYLNALRNNKAAQ